MSLTITRGSRGGRQVYQHPRGGTSRGQGFNRGGAQPRYYNKPGRGGYQQNFNKDGDVPMGGEAGAGRRNFNPYARKSDSNFKRNQNTRYTPGGNFGRRSLPADLVYQATQRRGSNTQGEYWYKIKVPQGNKWEKSFILQSLTNLTQVPFEPLQYGVGPAEAIFYVRSQEESDALRRVSGKGTFPNGTRLLLVITTCQPPDIPLNDDIKSKIKAIMSQRYDTAQKRLDLSKFQEDATLQSANIYASLRKRNVLAFVYSVIQENIPEVEAIDISYNALQSRALLDLIPKVPHLKKLSIRSSNIRNAEDLRCIKGFKLEELDIQGNNLRRLCKTEDAYVKLVRQIFPKLTVLDGKPLPAAIAFDVESSVTLPPSHYGYFIVSESKEVVLRFLSQYIGVYDTGDRQQLLPAYAEDAIFSMTFVKDPHDTNQYFAGTEYTKDSRNLLSDGAKNIADKLLQRGRINIVSFLSRLPPTAHNPPSTTVDVTIATPQLVHFVVTGIFSEGKAQPGAAVADTNKKLILRSYCRCFTCVPQGGGLVIINEMLSVAQPTMEQIDNFRKLQDALQQPLQPPAVAGTSAIGAASVSAQVQPIQAADPQQTMILKFATWTGMNVAYAEKCLSEAQWNYDNACLLYTDTKSKGMIPQEAFIK